MQQPEGGSTSQQERGTPPQWDGRCLLERPGTVGRRQGRARAPEIIRSSEGKAEAEEGREGTQQGSVTDRLKRSRVQPMQRGKRTNMRSASWVHTLVAASGGV